ncbi:YncE family protein [Chloroflexota bacterium]
MVDPSTGHNSIIRSGDGYYFGITSKNGTIVLTHSAGYLQYFDGKTNPIRTKDLIFNAHQVEWIDNNVIAANTGRNCLSVFDSNANWIRDVFFNEIRINNKKKKIGNHFNSVHKTGNHIFVLSHNQGKPSEVWILNWPDLSIEETIKSGAYWAHNIWSGEWGLVICDSKHGSLYELTSGETIWRSDESGMLTRGLAVSKDYIFVGHSKQSDNKERYWSTSGVSIIDRKTLHTVEKLVFPGSGQLLEIRLIDCLDECHNDQIIKIEDLTNIRRISPIMGLAYKIRKTYPLAQRDLVIISQILRAKQILIGWKRKSL